MLDLIKKAISEVSGREAKIHATREFLQLLMLKSLYDKGYFKNLAFVGGTALRFVYDLKRFSEDLDFSLINREGYKFSIFLKKIADELERTGFSLEIKKKEMKNVQSAMFRFGDLLFLLGLSDQRTQNLSIKVELDTNPPHGWDTQLSLVSRQFVFTVTHFDIPSLYATKLHACFFRKYAKGRDFYDLLWFLGRKALPNFELLNNAIEQTEHKRVDVNQENLSHFLREKLAEVDFSKIRRDVERFIEDKSQLRLLEKDLILQLL